MHYGDHDELILEQPSQNIKNSFSWGNRTRDETVLSWRWIFRNYSLHTALQNNSLSQADGI